MTTKADRYATTATIDGQTVKLTCEAYLRGGGYYGRGACGKDAHVVKFSASRVDAKREPLCNVHAAVERRGWSVKNGYDVLTEAIVDDVIAQHARKVEADAARAVERARKNAEADERNARYTARRAAEAARLWNGDRVDDFDWNYGSDLTSYVRVPKWVITPADGSRYDSASVKFGVDGGQRVIELSISSRLDVNAARALWGILDAALTEAERERDLGGLDANGRSSLTDTISRDEYEAIKVARDAAEMRAWHATHTEAVERCAMCNPEAVAAE